MQLLRKRRRLRWLQNRRVLAGRILQVRALLSPLPIGSQEQFLNSPKAGWSYFSCRLVRFRRKPSIHAGSRQSTPSPDELAMGLTGLLAVQSQPASRRPSPCPHSPCASLDRRPCRLA